MKLYIVMPVINCLAMTQAAIASIDSGLEANLILIDNKSDDGTRNFAESYSGHGNNIKMIYVRNEERRGVAASWNQGVEIALKDPECKYISIVNNDVIFHKKTFEHLMSFQDKTGYLMVTADNVRDRMSADVMSQMELPMAFTDFDTWPIEGWRAEGPDFSCFMINKETIRVLGWFDENFIGGYCEDQDYHARLDRARRHIKQHNDFFIEADRVHAKRLSTAPYFHYGSQTLLQNNNLKIDISSNHGKNQNYYLLKWGGNHPDVMDGGGHIQPFGDARRNWRWWEGSDKYENIR